MRLQTQDEPKTVLDILEELASDAAREFNQEFTIDSDDLRHIRDRIPSQSRHLGRDQYITGSIEETKVGAQHDGDHGMQSTSVEGVGLNNQHRSAVPRLGAFGLPQIRGPHLTPFDCHGSRVSDRPCRRLTASASRLSSDS